MSRATRVKGRRAAWLVAMMLATGCDSGSYPVGPSGTLFSISANPLEISLHGTSSVEVVARDPSGVPVREGTEVRFQTTLGRIDTLVRTDAAGVARATLQADGIAGSAVVTATSGINTASVTVSVESRPVAAFGCNGSGLRVVFSDQSTGDPTSWRWDFGDGSTSGDKDPTHTYRGAGSYLVELTVRNDGGEDRVARFAVVPGSGDVCSVSVARPVASFSCNASDLTVIFADASSGEPTRWRWEFGDGGRSSEKDPIHTYAGAGTYVVKLTVGNSSGEDSASRFATVPGAGEVCS